MLTFWDLVAPKFTVTRLFQTLHSAGRKEQYSLFLFFIPFECCGAPCLLCLVLQELCSSLFLFEHVDLIIQGLLLLL